MEDHDMEGIEFTTYIQRRFRRYWVRYLLLASVIFISVAMFVVVLSLFYGLQVQPTTLAPPEIILRRHSLSDTEASALAGWLVIAGGLLGLAMVGAVFNAIRASVWSARREIAILKAIGLTDSEITTIFVYEAMWVAVVSWICGLLVGSGISNQLLHHLYAADSGAMFFAPSGSRVAIVLLSLLLTLLVTLAGSIRPALAASRLEALQ